MYHSNGSSQAPDFTSLNGQWVGGNETAWNWRPYSQYPYYPWVWPWPSQWPGHPPQTDMWTLPPPPPPPPPQLQKHTEPANVEEIVEDKTDRSTLTPISQSR